MGYTYRNKKTKETINTTNKVTGKNWELVEDTDTQLPNGEHFEEDAFDDEIPEDTTGEDFEEDTFEEDTFEEDTFEDDAVEEEPNQTEAAEEVPAGKPKTSRRGKK